MSTWTQSSRLLGAIDHGFELGRTAWHTSVVKLVSESLWKSVAREHPVERLRLAGWFVLSAALAHVVLVGPRRLLVPWGSGLGWFVAMGMAIACIYLPQAVVAAWFRSRLAPRRKPS